MKLLLDTHIWLWSIADPSHLTQRIKRELEDTENEIWLSPISTWEIALLARKGRITLNDEPEAWIRKALGMVSFKEAVLNHEVALQSTYVDLPHSDPADRFLAASAMIYDLTLVTADKHLFSSREFLSLANK